MPSLFLTSYFFIYDRELCRLNSPFPPRIDQEIIMHAYYDSLLKCRIIEATNSIEKQPAEIIDPRAALEQPACLEPLKTARAEFSFRIPLVD